MSAWGQVGTVIAAIASAIVGFVGFRRAKKKDDSDERTADELNSREQARLVLDALEKFAGSLQTDNAVFRESLRLCGTRLDAMTVERDELRAVNADLRRRLGDPPTR